MKKILSSIWTYVFAIGGAAFSGAAVAAVQYVTTNGTETDWNAVGAAAATGAVVGVAGLLKKQPQAE